MMYLFLGQIYHMRSLMQFEMVRLPKTFPALPAYVWFFPCVRSLVSFQPVGAQKALLALAARVRLSSCVVPQMNGQIARLGELFTTVRTLKGLLSGVESLVLQQLRV